MFYRAEAYTEPINFRQCEAGKAESPLKCDCDRTQVGPLTPVYMSIMGSDTSF